MSDISDPLDPVHFHNFSDYIYIGGILCFCFFFLTKCLTDPAIRLLLDVSNPFFSLQALASSWAYHLSLVSTKPGVVGPG